MIFCDTHVVRAYIRESCDCTQIVRGSMIATTINHPFNAHQQQHTHTHTPSNIAMLSSKISFAPTHYFVLTHCIALTVVVVVVVVAVCVLCALLHAQNLKRRR